MKTRLVFAGCVVLTTLGFACGCRENPKAVSPALFPDGLAEDAQKTYSAHVRALNAGGEKLGNEIPPGCWAERIKALHPLKVYTHRANIVVVQRLNDSVEEGKYINILISSYLPQTGDDGFVFSPNPKSGSTYRLGNGVFDFKRTTDK